MSDIVKWLRDNQLAARGCGDCEADRYGEAASTITTLTTERDAALAAVARMGAEMEALRAALSDAVELLDVCWGHDPGANLQYRWGPQPYQHAQRVRDAARAALSAAPPPRSKENV